MSKTLDSLGLFANSVDDARICFDALVGAQERGARVDGALRIGVLAADELQSLEPAVAQSLADSLARLQAAGHELVAFRFPAPLAEFRAPTNAIMIAEGAAVNDALLDDPALPMDPSVRPRLIAARSTTAVQYLQAQATALLWQQQFAQDMDRLQLAAIAMPVTALAAPRLQDVDHDVAPVHFSRPVNFLALCGISLPAGQDAAARPIGLQLVGRAGDDQALLALAAAVDRAISPVPVPSLEVCDAP
jgi:aspartyl-tRNA(Asn)/glutamyl-tRNA(Gln) amidotransferase subunit A